MESDTSAQRPIYGSSRPRPRPAKYSRFVLARSRSALLIFHSDYALFPFTKSLPCVPYRITSHELYEHPSIPCYGSHAPSEVEINVNVF